MRVLLVIVMLTACSSSSDPVCGDGEVYSNTNDPLAFEECDDGNAIDGDGCSMCLRDFVCGDGVVDPGEDCDDGNVASGDGCSATCDVEPRTGLMVSWQFKTVGGATQSCPSGFDTARVVSEPLGGGQTHIDMFTCSAMMGNPSLPPDRYRVHVEITNSSGSSVYARSVVKELDLRTAGGTYATTISTDGGYFTLAWTLRGMTTNNVLTCAQAGATSVSLLSTVTSSTSAFEDLFQCGDGAGISRALGAGSYTVSISALDQTNASVGQAPVLINQVIQAPNKVTDLGTITIPITGM
jgi:cysteine-rich repeat protein